METGNSFIERDELDKIYEISVACAIWEEFKLSNFLQAFRLKTLKPLLESVDFILKKYL